jgi:hypothetical protein
MLKALPEKQQSGREAEELDYLQEALQIGMVTFDAKG